MTSLHRSRGDQRRGAIRSGALELDAQPRPPVRFASGTNQFVAEDVAPRAPAWTVVGNTRALELAAIPHAMFVIGADGRIEDANTRAEMLVGYVRAELVGQLMDRIVSDLGNPAPDRSAARVDGVRFVPVAHGVCVHHRSGREVPVEVLVCPHEGGSLVAHVSPMVGFGGVVGALDVAEVVHDLKNPLAAIALEMCLLRDRVGDHGPSEIAAVIARVGRNVDFLDRVVQDLLDSSAIDAGQLAVRREPTELSALLDTVVLRMIAVRDRWRVFVEAAAPITVSIDTLRIERVVANLLQNALKFAPRTSKIVVSLELRDGAARVSVVDTGPGMTSEESAYVFDKYRRAARAQVREGHGLGLYVSKQIVEAHGGRMGVDSVEGVGSSFFFELPVP